VKAVILCGGRGTRLREETEFKPKPLVEIGGMPILWHIMKSYSQYGVKDFILCLGYKGDKIKDYFLNYDTNSHSFNLNLKSKNVDIIGNNSEDWNITFVDTGLEAETGARIKRIEKYIDGDEFFLTYGDGVADIDIDELYRFHKEHGKIGTVTAVRPLSRFGLLDIDGSNKVTDFSKKALVHDGWIDGGFFVFNRKIFDYLEDDDLCILEGAPLKTLSKDDQFMSFKHTGFWQCMDTSKHVDILNGFWNSGNAKWRMWDDVEK
jgi:glucose-1-phosphate cytidylyltransferase